MRQAFNKHIDRNFAFLKGKKVLVACSGGVDSVALAYLLVDASVSIALAHCNFSLRGGESDADEQFVADLGKQFDCPFISVRFDTKSFANNENMSTQMAARALRYQWFFEIKEKEKYDYIATAHHLDDDFETYLINTTRATGLRGLTGIPEKTETIVRPLLPFSKKEIEEFAVKNKIKWREDSSNQTTDYLRNKLRIEVVPKLKEAEPQLLKNFKTTQSYLNDSLRLLEDYIHLIYKDVVQETEDGYTFSISKLKKIPNTGAVLYELLHSFGFTEWHDVCELLDAQTGKHVLSKTHILLKDRDRLVLNKREEPSDEIYTIENETDFIENPISLQFKTIEKEAFHDEELSATGVGKNVIYIDQNKINFPLNLRHQEQGDVFYPYGMEGKKKISKFFKDEKLSLFAKEKKWLLCSGSKIVWIIGHSADRRFRVTSNTTSILKITYNE